MIKLYIFDQGGLVSRDMDVLPEAALRMGVDPALLRELLQPDMAAFMEGKLAEPEIWRRLRERSGLVAGGEYWSELFHPTMDIPTFELFSSIRAAGTRVVCGTNTIASHYDALRALGHYECFDAVYASQILGLAKPDPAFWRRILEIEGVLPGECFFADDLEENVAAAAALGIDAALFVGASELARRLEAAIPCR